MYENNIRKKALGMFAAGMISFSTLLTGFSGINNVQASIKTNLPKSYMSDNFPNSYKPYIDALKSSHPIIAPEFGSQLIFPTLKQFKISKGIVLIQQQT